MIKKVQALFKKTDNQGQLALDLVEAGDDSDRYGKGERVTKALPPGISSKMLYNDIVKIAWPSFVELTLTQLASMVDLMMVGSLGPWAISAVGLTMQPKFLMMTAFMAMNVGATALIARAKGQDNPERANTVLNQSMFLTFVLSLAASTIISCPLSRNKELDSLIITFTDSIFIRGFTNSILFLASSDLLFPIFLLWLNNCLFKLVSSNTSPSIAVIDPTPILANNSIIYPPRPPHPTTHTLLFSKIFISSAVIASIFLAYLFILYHLTILYVRYIFYIIIERGLHNIFM